MRKEVELEDRKITVIGTSHVSEKSKEEVKQAIDEVNPDLVAVELDESRLNALKGEDTWKNMDVAEAIRGGQGYLLFLNVFLSIYQRRIGLQEDINPGEEMMAAVSAAEEKEVEVGLIDRDINQTFRRAMDELTLWEKIKLMSSIMVTTDEIDPEELTEGDMVENLVLELKEEYPSLNRTFLEERNSYMAEKLMEEDFDHAVAVVGAAHVDGFTKDLEDGNGHEIIERDSISWSKVLKYGIPAFIILSIGYSFVQLGTSAGIRASAAWILLNAIFAAIGAIIARSHPITWVVSFISSPITSLNPAIGAGMVAAYSEAKLRPPKVRDLETISELESYRELWGNQVGVILLTFVLVSIGSAAATFISAGYIASLISGL